MRPLPYSFRRGSHIGWNREEIRKIHIQRDIHIEYEYNENIIGI